MLSIKKLLLFSLPLITSSAFAGYQNGRYIYDLIAITNDTKGNVAIKNHGKTWIIKPNEKVYTSSESPISEREIHQTEKNIDILIVDTNQSFKWSYYTYGMGDGPIGQVINKIDLKISEFMQK